MDHNAILLALRDSGLISEEDRTRSVRSAQISPDTPSPLFHVRALNLVSEQDLVRVMANAAKVPGWILESFSPPPALIDRIGVPNMRRMGVIPIQETGTAGRTEIAIGMANPEDQDNLDTLRILFGGGGVKMIPHVVSPFDLDRLLAAYGHKPSVGDSDAGVQSLDAILGQMVGFESEIETEGTQASAAMDDEIESAPVVQVVDGLIGNAVVERASDIHIEPMSTGLQIRFRIDGALLVRHRLPLIYGKAIATVVKNKGKMDMTDRMRPQDGRIRVRVQNRQIDLRVSTLPGRYGEKIVIRILDHAAVQPELDNLGMEPPEHKQLTEALVSPHGLILVTGPTGSGKTTTLYAMLNRLNKPDVNIITVEDPVEYEMPGITQVATNDKANLTFAEILKSVLRQDPDIIMVGEVRDQETAQTAMRAALTGHLVLSTIHTNDAAEALTRLLDLGVERANLAGSARLMVAQRLLRRLCLRCRVQVPPDPAHVAPLLRDQMRAVEMAAADEQGHEAQEQLSAMQQWFEDNREYFYARNPSGGCVECSGTGYHGRIGIYEIIEVTEEIRNVIVAGGSAVRIREIAASQGTRSLRQVALMHAAHGTTSLLEVIENTI